MRFSHLLLFFVYLCSLVVSDTLCNAGQAIRQNGCDITLNDCLFSGLRALATDYVTYGDPGKGGAIFTDRSSTSPAQGCTAQWYFRIYFNLVRFENCYASVRGGAIDIITQAEDINATSFVNCSAGVSGGGAYVQAVGFAYDQPVGLGWINLRGILLEACSSQNSALLLNSTIHDTLPISNGGTARYDRDQDVVLSVFNATGNRAESFGSAVYFFEQKIILLQYARFVGNAGENLVRIGPTIDNSDPLTCTFFLNNTILGGDVVRGIVYSEYTYTIETALFFGNNATWYFVVMPNRTWDMCDQTCTSSAYIGVTCTTSCVVQSATNNFTLKNCIFDTIGILEGPIHLIDCITSYQGDDIPDPCNFIAPSARSKTSKMTPIPTVSQSPTISTTPSPTISGTPSPTASTTPSPTISGTPSPTVSTTPSPTISRTPTATVSVTPSDSFSSSPQFVESLADLGHQFAASLKLKPTDKFTASLELRSSGTFVGTPKFSASPVFPETGPFSSSVQFEGTGLFSASSVFVATGAFSTSSGLSGSDAFPSSETFPLSGIFGASRVFSLSFEFTGSVVFTPSGAFGESAKFASTLPFSQSVELTSSSLFTDSLKFAGSVPLGKSPSFKSTSAFSLSGSFTLSSVFASTEKFTKSSEFGPSGSFANSLEFGASKTFVGSGALSRTASFKRSDLFYASHKFNGSATFALIVAAVTSNEAKVNAAVVAGAAAGSVVGALALAGLALLALMLFRKKKQSALLPDDDGPTGDTLEDLTLNDNEEPEDFVSEYGLSAEDEPTEPANGDDPSAGPPSAELESEDRYVSERQSGSEHPSFSDVPEENSGAFE